MSNEISELKELGVKITEYAKAVTELQKSNDALLEESKKTGIELDSLKDTTIREASEAAAKALDEANQIKQNMQAVQKTQEYLEKALSRMGESGDTESKELDKKAADQMARYLRTGDKMDDDVVEKMAHLMCDESFHGISEQKKDHEIKTLIAGVNPAGGYFIRPQRSATMIKRIFETSPLRNYANVESTSGDTLEMIIDDNEAGAGGWVGEVDERSETGTPKVGLLTIPVHEQFAQPLATQKMVDDAGFDIESWLSGKVTRKLSRDENTAFVVGDGSQKPKGFLTYPAWAVAGVYERNKVEQVNSGAAGDFTADGLKLIQNAVKEEYQGASAFFTKRANFFNITRLKDGDNQYLLDPRSLKMGDTKVLLGKDVVFMNDIQDVGANALALVYGDMSTGYTIVDRFGFRVIRDIFTKKPYIKYYTTKRVGGAVTNYESFKILKVAS